MRSKKILRALFAYSPLSAFALAQTMLITVLVLMSQAQAQTITGSMSGRVVDQQGAMVADAVVKIADPTKNLLVTRNTSLGGDFSVAGLSPGTYSVTVEAVGFKKLSRSGVALDANDRLALGDLVLEVGSITESVEVSGQAALLKTESVERSATISGKQIENIEVNGRNPLDLAKLVPGVVNTGNNNTSVGNSNGLNNFAVNGARQSQNQLTINGIGDVDTGNNGQQNVTVSMDSIAEFKILTGTYQAEYGRSAGAQIAVVTKSGTEQFHGAGYLYHRNDSLNANSFLNNLQNRPRPLFRYNDPGFWVGGPIFIPKYMERTRNKAFFFWSQEWQNQLVPNTARNVTVPTALERKGDFSQSVDSNLKPIAAILDPITRVPFPNKIIPPSQIYGPGQALLNLLPLPNVTQTSNFNYTSQLPGVTPRREDLLRVDYNLRDNLRVFGHYINNTQPAVEPYGSFVLGLNVPIAQISDPRPGRSLAAGATWIVNPTMTNEFNWGYTKNSINIFEQSDVLRRKTSGVNLPLLYPSSVQDDYIPQVNFGGKIANSPSFGTSNAGFHNYNTTFDFSDNLTKVWGKHTIKTGAYLQRSRKDQTSFAAANGSYNFGDNSSNPYDTGFGFSNALLGVYNTFQQSSAYINGKYRYTNLEAFVQDTWKLTPRLTLDYGLRGAWYQPQYDSSLQASTFVPSLWDPKNAPTLYQPAINPTTGARAAFDPRTNTYLPSFDVGLEIPGSGSPFQGICQAGKCVNKYLFNDRAPQWGPRFGVAWDVTGKQNIVVRTGGGIYYDRIQGNRIFDSVANPPEAVTPTLNQNLVSTIDPKNILLGPPSINMADPTGHIPTTYEYQFSIQTRLPFNMVLDTAYVGTLSRHLQNNRNINYNAFGQCYLPQNQDPQRLAANPNALLGTNCLDANFLKPYQGYNNINLYESQSTSNYNALQIELQRHTAKGLFIGVAYTWSKALATAQSGQVGANANDNAFVRPDQFNRLANYGPLSFDRRQILAINYVYTVPKANFGNTFTRLATDGWQVSGVTQAISGTPFTPTFTISGLSGGTLNQVLTGSNSEGARIGIVKGCDPYTHSNDPFNRLNPACFTAPMPGSLGLESGVNYLYGPGQLNFDVAVQKEFSIKERVKFQFRVDAFNVFNHTNFTGLNSALNFNAYPSANGIITGQPTLSSTALGRNPNGSFNVSGFGTVTQPAPGLLGYARILQAAFRVQF